MDCDSQEAAANKLGIAISTLTYHLAIARAKAGAASTVRLVVLFIRSQQA